MIGWASLAVVVILLWAHFRPSIDLADMSFSTRGFDHLQKYWRNTWYTWFAFRCPCGAWGGCGKHWLCGMCRECRVLMEGPDEGPIIKRYYEICGAKSEAGTCQRNGGHTGAHSYVTWPPVTMG